MSSFKIWTKIKPIFVISEQPEASRVPVSPGLPGQAPVTTGQPVILILLVFKSRWYLVIQRWPTLSRMAAVGSAACFLPGSLWRCVRCSGWVERPVPLKQKWTVCPGSRSGKRRGRHPPRLRLSLGAVWLCAGVRRRWGEVCGAVPGNGPQDGRQSGGSIPGHRCRYAWLWIFLLYFWALNI